MSVSDIIIEKNMRLPTVERIKEAISKTGATPFIVNNVEVKVSSETVEKTINSELAKNENTASVLPVSAINALRREGIAKLEDAISQRPKKQVTDYNIPQGGKRKKATETEYRIRVENVSQIGKFRGDVILPLWEAEKLNESFDKNRIILELPILIYPKDEQRVTDELKRLKEKGFKNLLCENISFIRIAKAIGFKVYAGAYTNILNRISLSEYEKMGVEDITLSFEVNDGDIGYFNSENKVGIIGYGHLGVMQMRNCPIKAFVGCKNCDKVVKDRLSKEFPILCRGDYVTMLNSVPLSVSGKSFPVDFITLYFTKETPSEVENIINGFLKGNEPNEPHTKGLYFRKLV
jgi:putative protease